MNDHEPGTPEYVIRSVLYGVTSFPEKDIPKTVAALTETLQQSGLVIVQTNDHVDRTTIEALADRIERSAGEVGGSLARHHANLIRNLNK